MTNIVIIGAGPAGLSAALQLKRSGFDPVVFERDEPGGLLHNANLVENYPGFPDGIPGPDLIRLMVEQVQHVGVEILCEEVIRAEYSAEVFSVQTPAQELRAPILIIASGTKPIPLLLPHPLESVGDTIFYEVYPLAELKGARIIVLGVGDAAFDYALNLAARGNQITIVHRGDKTACLPLLRRRAEHSGQITYRANVQVRSIEKKNGGIKILSSTNNSPCEIEADYLVVAYGREPRLDFISRKIIENCDELRDSHVLYLIGDTINGNFRQAAIAVGDGIRAGMDIYQHWGKA